MKEQKAMKTKLEIELAQNLRDQAKIEEEARGIREEMKSGLKKGDYGYSEGGAWLHVNGSTFYVDLIDNADAVSDMPDDFFYSRKVGNVYDSTKDLNSREEEPLTEFEVDGFMAKLTSCDNIEIRSHGLDELHFRTFYKFEALEIGQKLIRLASSLK